MINEIRSLEWRETADVRKSVGGKIIVWAASFRISIDRFRSCIMSTGSKLRTIGGVFALSAAVLCTGNPASAQINPVSSPAKPVQSQAKPALKKAAAKKQQKLPPPPLPSGPTGQPVQQIPLDSIAAVPPQVSYENNQLTIVAPNSTLADILRAVRKQTGADIDVPAAPERVVTRLGPGPARDVVAELLNGSRFNYVLLGAPDNDLALTRIVLVAKSGVENMPNPAPPQNQQANNSAVSPQPQTDQPSEMANDAEQVDDNPNAVDDNADQQPPPTEAEQQPSPDQPPQGVKTPQQLLQEMQQRQMQMQQQQAPGQMPMPGSGMPPHPPLQNQNQ